MLFDLGGVLIEWDPRRLYRRHFEDEALMERFLAEVCTPAWNHAIDLGQPLGEAVAERQAAFPEHAPLIALYASGWADMLGEAIQGTVDLLGELHGQGVKVCALSNWSAETFPVALARFPFLGWFERIVISGEVRLAKPDPAIFTLALAACGLEAADTVFIDDVPANVATARSLGLDAILFQDPEHLRAQLAGRGLVSPRIQ